MRGWRPRLWAACAVLAGAALLVPRLMRPAGAAAPDPVVTSLTLFGGDARGFWRSNDWGASWQRLRSAVLDELGPVHTIRPVGPRVWVGGRGGLLASDDFGASFKRTGELSDVRALLGSRYVPADPTVFAGTGRGLWRSPDDGRSFERTLLEGAAVTRLEWPGPALFIGTALGLRVSDDGARSFRPPPQGLPEGPLLSLALSSYFAADPVAYAGVGETGVWRSADGGRTWTQAGLPGRTVYDLVWLGPTLYAATDAGLFRDQENGRRWERIGAGLGEGAVTALLFPLAPDSGAEAFALTSGGLFRTLDGGLRFERRASEVFDVLATFPPPDPPRKKR